MCVSWKSDSLKSIGKNQAGTEIPRAESVLHPELNKTGGTPEKTGVLPPGITGKGNPLVCSLPPPLLEFVFDI